MAEFYSIPTTAGTCEYCNKFFKFINRHYEACPVRQAVLEGRVMCRASRPGTVKYVREATPPHITYIDVSNTAKTNPPVSNGGHPSEEGKSDATMVNNGVQTNPADNGETHIEKLTAAFFKALEDGLEVTVRFKKSTAENSKA